MYVCDPDAYIASHKRAQKCAPHRATALTCPLHASGSCAGAAPRLWEMFVAYGKDRVSFTYELAARGFVMVVQPEAFLVHYRTPALGTSRCDRARSVGNERESCT